MAKKTRTIKIKGPGGKFTLSVNPKSLKVAGGEETVTFSFLNKGTVELPGNRKPVQISFDTFLPDKTSPFYRKGSKTPKQIIKLMYKWKNGKKAVRIVISGTRINMKCFIKSPVEEYVEGDKDIYVSWSFVEDRRSQLTSASSKTKKSTKKTKLNDRGDKKEIPKYIVWKKSYTLWDLAKKYYGDGSYAIKIAKLNKVTNEKKIKTGTKLEMPQDESESKW